MQVGIATDVVSTQRNEKKRDTVGYDAFLQLLVAQLRNQDPMKPVDSTQYVSQLATLSELEQSLQQTDAIERLERTMAWADAGALVGKRVTSVDTSVTGVVEAVILESGGNRLLLDNGQQLMAHQGMRVAAP